MANLVKWGALGASTLAGSAEFDSLADGANAAASLISASQNTYADWFMHTETLSASVGHLALYLVTQFGGSAAYGGATVDPAPNLWVGNFVSQATAGSQNMPLNFIFLPNRDFTPVVINETGSALSGCNNFLYFQQYNDEIQD